MSTRSNIIIKVKPEDIGKTVKFNAKMLPVPLKSWGKEKAPSKCKIITLEKPYIGIYCHWDGYPSGVGADLLSTFNDYDSILNLIIGGDCSSIGEDSIQHYSNRKGEQWKYIKPKQINKIEAWGGAEYAYVFEDDKWHVGVVKYKKIGDKYEEYVDEFEELTDDIVERYRY